MDFPAFTDPGPLTEPEIEALRSLHVTLQDMRHEYQSALALTERCYRLGENAEVYTHGRALSHHPEALHLLGGLADHFERGVGLLTWRYAAAAVVLGTGILERVVGGRPALTAEAVGVLCEEPTLGELRDALSIPSTTLLIARRESVFVDRHEKERLGLLRALEGVIECAAEIDDGLPADLWAGRLTAFDRPGRDPLYEGVLDGLLSCADQLPHEIGRYVKQSRAGALPAQVRT